jgi:NAD(P)-dependent dehydrogenase (short-subunit alcohol dehydrogenase family)
MTEGRADLSGRVYLVTGASGGIGREIARNLALARATVVLAARDEARGKAALEDITTDTCNDRVELLLVDVSRQASIARFLAAFRERHDTLHALVNNAGIWPGERTETDEGIETTWATNVLAYHYLATGLLDVLKKSAPSRVVNVASKVAYGLDLSDVEFRRRKFDGALAYAQSKQADRMLTWALADRLEGTGVVANACHPGMIGSEITRAQQGIFGKAAGTFFRVFGKTPAEGADTPTYVATSDEEARSSGNFYVKRKIKKCPYRDPAQLSALVDLCESMRKAV